MFGYPDPVTGERVGGLMQRKGIVDVSLGSDAAEVVTRRKPGDPPLQLDRIVTRGGVELLVRDIALDAQWEDPDEAAMAGLADHAPICSPSTIRDPAQSRLMPSGTWSPSRRMCVPHHTVS